MVKVLWPSTDLLPSLNNVTIFSNCDVLDEVFFKSE